MGEEDEKLMKKLSLVVAMLLGSWNLFSSLGFSQISKEPLKEGCVKPLTVVEKTVLASDTWETKTVQNLKFTVPKTFVLSKKRCRHGDCIFYSRDDFVVTMDISSAAFRPFSERYDDSVYKEKVTQKGSFKYWSWSMTGNEGQSKFKAGIIIWDEVKKQYVAGLYIHYNCSEDLQVVDKIIESVEYTIPDSAPEKKT